MATTPGDDEIITNFTPESGRAIYGPCPICGNWQLDAPYLESRAVVEAVLREHDAEAHPGLLGRLVASTGGGGRSAQ